MSVRERSVRVIVAAAVALVLVVFAAVQLASDSLYASAAAPSSFPSRIPEGFGLTVYRTLDRIAPAPYVESTLARAALSRGDTANALHYALRLPPNAVRNGLLARVAAARGEDVLAFEYAFVAPDIETVQASLLRMSATHPEDAYHLEERFRDRLMALETHPDAVAHAWWMLGVIASSMHGNWQSRAYDDYVRAAILSPLDVQHVLAAANEAVTIGRWDDAAHWYGRALEVNPASADAIAGLGIVAWDGRRDRAAADSGLAAARAIDPLSKLVATLERQLRARP